MSGRLVLRAYGRLIELVGDPLALELARERLPDAFQPGRGRVERSWSVIQDETGHWYPTVEEETLGDRPHVSSAVELALSSMELWVAEHAEECVFLHAGCVVCDGRALVLPGRTLTGKTTLVRALTCAGAEYFSDEFAPIDARGFVHPYPRPLAIRFAAPGTERVYLADLESPVGMGPARCSLIAMLSFDDAAGWEVKPVSRPHAILGLLDNTVPARTRPLQSLATMEQATKDACALVGTRGDADEAAAMLLDLLMR